MSYDCVLIFFYNLSTGALLAVPGLQTGKSLLSLRSTKKIARLSNLITVLYLCYRLFQSKIAERVIFDQLYEFCLDFLSGNLSGFLKGHSCTTALLKTCEDIRKNLDSREHSAAITIDLSEAFDSINHNLLLAKLSAYGVTEDALQLLRSYLTD